MDNIRKARALKLYKLSKIIDDDDEDELHFALLVSGQKQRRVKWKHQRIDWDIHLKMLRHTGGFQSRYHMTESTFNKLVDILREALEKNERQSIQSKELDADSVFESERTREQQEEAYFPREIMMSSEYVPT